MTNEMTLLKAERAKLAAAYSRADGGFPGSVGWRAAQAAEKALADFDLAHPEVIREIKSARSASLRATRMED